MKDFRIANAKIVLKVHSLSPIRGFRPTSILVVGEKFDRAQEVYYNGLLTTEFIIQSQTRMIVRVPNTQVGKQLLDLKVVSNAHLAKQDASIFFELTKPPRIIEGIERLIQSWLMIWMSTPGSNVFDKSSGGGAYSIIGRSTDRQHKGVAADLAISIEKTTQELVKLQAGSQIIPAAEKLLSASLESVQFDEKTTTLSAQVTIQNMIGEQGEITVR